jgi:uncharacterized membrane protein YdjX (TVP38/TMEM64 family)/SAM-dependent methyltransferase
MKKAYLKILLALIIVVVIYLFKSSEAWQYLTLDILKEKQDLLKNFYANNPIQTVASFMGIYIVATALSLPGATILTLCSGVLFGFWTGTILVSFASTIGATLAFLTARFLFKETIQNRFREKLERINDGVKKDGSYYLLTLRLIPLFPFFLVNLVMGLTPIRTITYFFVSQIGMLPGTVVYVNAGTELAQINSLKGILSPSLLLSFFLIGILPFFSKWALSIVKSQKHLEHGKKPIQGLESVKKYYGKILKSSEDLKTSACCTTESMPLHLREILKEIHDEVKDKFYGCGSPIPPAIEEQTVLDLGSGTGRDCFILSKLVGPSGRVIGIDMTDEQITVAKRHVDYHTKKFGFSEPNVKFIKGYIEDLESAGIKSGSVDAIVSNCVINLSPNKERVFSEIFRVLKPGGELYFSDVFSGRRIPNELTQDPTLIGECLGGALYIEDFRRMLASLGCQDYRMTARSRIFLQNAELERKVGMIDFYSMTIRAFKLNLEDRCEDYGQVACYLGTIPALPHAFCLDNHHIFEKGRPVLVCSNTAEMLVQTRYSQHFKIIGDQSVHYGLFNCGPTNVASESKDGSFGSCC